MKHHLKFKKVFASDVLDRFIDLHCDGMGKPEQLCSVLNSLGISCNAEDLITFLESINSFCDDDGRYSWYELVSFLQPHSHFESTCTLLSWHMQCNLKSTAGGGMHNMNVTNSAKTEIGHAHNITMDHDSFKRRLRLYQQHDTNNFWYSAKAGMISAVKVRIFIFTL